MKKRVISLLTATMMLVTVLPVNASANDGIVLRADSVTAECKAGETVSLTVSADENTGYVNGLLDICWDSEALELTDVQFNAENAPDNGSAAIISDGQYILFIGNNLTKENFTGTGTFFTLSFAVTDKAKPADYAVTLENAAFRDTEIAKVPVSCHAGMISLTGESAADPDAMELQIGSAEAVLGDDAEIRIPVTAKTNPGFISGLCNVLWDASALTLKEIEFSALAPDNGSEAITSDGSYTVAFGDYLAKENTAETGTLFTLVFAVNDGAAAGNYPVMIANPDVRNDSLAKIPAAVNAGAVLLKAQTTTEAITSTTKPATTTTNTTKQTTTSTNITKPTTTTTNTTKQTTTTTNTTKQTTTTTNTTKQTTTTTNSTKQTTTTTTSAQQTTTTTNSAKQTTTTTNSAKQTTTTTTSAKQTTTTTNTTTQATTTTNTTKQTTTTTTFAKQTTTTTDSTKQTTTTTTSSGTTGTTTETTAVPVMPSKGDYNGDGDISIADAVLLARFVGEDTALTVSQIAGVLLAKPDFDSDGFVTVLDVAALLKRI